MKKSFVLIFSFFICFSVFSQSRNRIAKPTHGQLIGKWLLTNQPLRAWIDGNKIFVIQGDLETFIVRGSNMLTRLDVESAYKKYAQNFMESTGNDGLNMPESFKIPSTCIEQYAKDGSTMIICGEKAKAMRTKNSTNNSPNKETVLLPNKKENTQRRGKSLNMNFSGYPKIADGFSYLKADGSVRDVVSKLDIQNGRLSEEKWAKLTLVDNRYEKGYYIGLSSRSTTTPLQNIDVSAMAGFDLSVIEVYTEKGNYWKGRHWIQQYITVPGQRMATDTIGKSVYFWNPSQFVSESLLPDFYDSFPDFTLPKNKIVKFSFACEKDPDGQKATKKGVTFIHNAQNDAQKAIMDYDGWLYKAGCPQAYTVSQDVVRKWLDRVNKNQLRDNFSHVVGPNINTGYLSLNFEPIGVYFESPNLEKISYAFEELKAKQAKGEFAIWSANPKGLSRIRLEDEKNTQGFTQALKWQGAGFDAYNEAFPEMGTRNLWGYVRNAVSVSQVGSYCNDVRNISTIYHLMAEGLLSKKIEPNKKTLANIWHDIEIFNWELGEQTHRTSRGEVFKVQVKPTVPPDLMQSWGVWSMWLDGLDLWSDPNLKTDNMDLWGDKALDLETNKKKETRYGKNVKSSAFQPQKNIDWLMAGVWAMSMNKDILDANTPIEYADIELPNGKVIRGDDRLPTEAFIKGLPLVFRKKDDNSNDVLYTAYWGHNAANKSVTIKVDGQEIEIKGQYTSVVRIKN